MNITLRVNGKDRQLRRPEDAAAVGIARGARPGGHQCGCDKALCACTVHLNVRVRVGAADSCAAVVCTVDQKSRINEMMSSMSCCVSRMFESERGPPALEVNRNL
jgi:hypothetical protein